MKGLLDIPICVVEDNIERRILWSAPTGDNFSIHYRPSGHGRYSANINKHLPAIGIGEIKIFLLTSNEFYLSYTQYQSHIPGGMSWNGRLKMLLTRC